MIQKFVTKGFNTSFNESQPKLISVSKIDADKTQHPRIMHSHSTEAEILFVHDGQGVYVVNDTRYDIKKGDIIICNRNVLHDEEPNAAEGLSTFCCTITDLKFDDLEENCIIPPNIKPVIYAGHDYETINALYKMMFSILSDEARNKEESIHYMMLSLLTIVKDIITRNLEVEVTPTDELRRLCHLTKAYINNHYTEDISLKSIAETMAISPSYLSHVFKDIVGYPIMNYTLRRRIGESQTLLIKTKKSITAIAMDVGYSNPNYFNVVFTKYVGMSPSKYRKEYTD